MSDKPAYHTSPTTSTRDLTALTDVLKQDYAELIKTSVVLRKESWQLRDDSRLLRRINTKLLAHLSRLRADD